MAGSPSTLKLWFNPVVVALLGSLAFFGALGVAGVAPWREWPHPLRWALAAMFLLAASARLTPVRRALITMVPPGLPRPALLVDVAGVLEALGALGLLWDRTAPVAAICLALLLVVLFPANVHAARAGAAVSRAVAVPLPIRATQQVVFVVAAVACAF